MIEAIWGIRIILRAPEFYNDASLTLAYKTHELTFRRPRYVVLYDIPSSLVTPNKPKIKYSSRYQPDIL